MAVNEELFEPKFNTSKVGNVSINLGSIKDEVYVREQRARVAELVSRADQLKREILSIVEGRM